LIFKKLIGSPVHNIHTLFFSRSLLPPSKSAKLLTVSLISPEKKLGSGSVGEVYLAPTESGVPVALKILTNTSPLLKRLFEEEVRLLSRLKHPGLVQVLGFTAQPSPRFWMEFVDGGPIDEASRCFEPAVRQAWFVEALEALAYLHHQGVIHGDIKPTNLLVTREGHLKVVDFGLSAFRRSQSEDSGSKLGSLPYLAPEALSGDATALSDLFALGTVFFEIYSGHHPREGARNLKDLFAEPAVPLNRRGISLPPRYAKVIDRLIASDPRQRLSSAAEALEALGSKTAKRKTEKYGEPAVIPQSYQLFERETAWKEAMNFVTQARVSNRAGVIFLCGEPGTGRGRFAKELRIEIQLSELPSPVGDRFSENPSELYLHLQKSLMESGIAVALWNQTKEPPRHAQILTLTLENLSTEGTSRMLRALLGDDLPQDWIDEARLLTRGNPKLLAALAQQRLSHSSHLPQTFEEIYRPLLETLPAPERVFLEFLSAARQASVWHCSDFQGYRGLLEKFLQRGLVRRGAQGSYQIAHPQLSELILKEMTEAGRRHLHERWIGILERNPPLAVEAVIDRAWHRIQLPFSEHTLPDLLEASELLRDSKQFDQLIALLESISEFREKTSAAIHPLLRLLSNAYAQRGRFRQAIETADRWFETLGSQKETIDEIRYWLGTGIHAKNLGQLAEARRRLARCLGAASSKTDNQNERPFLARAHAVLGLLELEADQLEAAQDHFSQAAALVPESGEERAEIHRYMALLRARQKRPEDCQKELDAAETLYGATSHQRGLFSIALERGNLSITLPRSDNAESHFTKALKIATKTGLQDLRARALQNLGTLKAQAWHFEDARRFLESAGELFSFFGSPEDIAINKRQTAHVLAHLGLFGEARELGSTETDVGRILLSFLETGAWPKDAQDIFSKDPPGGDWDIESQWRQELPAALGFSGDAAQETARAKISNWLAETHARLSPARRISFEDRFDYKSWILKQSVKEENLMNSFERLSIIMKEILSSSDMETALVRIMDAAMDISKAERGFLMIQREGADGPIPGFEVKISRNLAKESVTQDRTISLSAVREAMTTGHSVLTDNAIQDGRFRDAPSVQQANLMAIFTLPLKNPEGVIGVLYLDHRYQPLIFRDEDQSLLQSFADQASLALQKSRMIEDLKSANSRLSQTVEDQTSRITLLEREVTTQRRELKREYGEIIGDSGPMLEVLQLVDRLVDTSVPVWIYGESGTGKESIARALHFQGPRSKKPFVSENCSSLPETLLESELFGHKKGSFTHADRDKKGLLHYADGGTVFLDEIADMSATLQAKLLRFLQEGEIRPVGSNEIVKVDVRVVSASNKDLRELISGGKFREDLFYRLNGVTLSLPALRERRDDIPVLISHFLKKAAEKEKKPVCEIAPDAMELLMNYSWPGNVRELENTIRTASVFHHRGRITAKSFTFKKELFGVSPIPASRPAAAKASHSKGGTGPVSEGKKLLIQALYDNSYQKLQAAKSLGVSRRHLYTQLVKYGIPVERLEMQGYVERELGLRK